MAKIYKARLAGPSKGRAMAAKGKLWWALLGFIWVMVFIAQIFLWLSQEWAEAHAAIVCGPANPWKSAEVASRAVCACAGFAFLASSAWNHFTMAH